MRSLVTGGAGFIGSHLVERLLELGDEVVVVDNFSAGRLENLDAVKADQKLEVFEADICEKGQLERPFLGVERVFHLAGMADIVPSIENPELYFRVNVLGTLNVLEAARKVGVKRLIYAASSSSYGIPDCYPTPETAPIAPLYPYALTKYQGEELVLHWSRTYHISALALRLFNVFGPRARTSGAYGAVFGVFLAQKLAGRPLTVVGDGCQTRDFTYVSDVVAAFITAAEREDVRGEALNVGSGGHYSVNQLVALIGGEVESVPKRPGEPDCTYADVTRIRQLLGWRAEVPFEEGVRRVLQHIEDWREAPVWDPQSIAEATRGWFSCLGERVDHS
ncbi:MAG: SDR family oxidoreductase [Gammaproteobacteria bacterium]|nr:SDR family oxidoreductase [Gammaproteobacteria bacterium]